MPGDMNETLDETMEDQNPFNEKFEKAKLAHYAARSAYMDLMIKEGKLVTVEAAQKTVEDFATIVKTNILSLASKLSPQLENVSARQAFALLDAEHRAILIQASDTLDNLLVHAKKGAKKKRGDTISAKVPRIRTTSKKNVTGIKVGEQLKNVRVGKRLEKLK